MELLLHDKENKAVARRRAAVLSALSRVCINFDFFLCTFFVRFEGAPLGTHGVRLMFHLFKRLFD